MSRRIDIELTSAQPDGTWTWRAAGARQPKGVLDGQVLYQGAKTGDVVRAEADFEIEGITIVSVAAPREKKRSEPERIELLSPTGPAVGGVTTQLVGRSDRRPERRRDRDEGAPGGSGRGPSGPRRSSGRPSGPGESNRGDGAARPAGDTRSRPARDAGGPRDGSRSGSGPRDTARTSGPGGPRAGSGAERNGRPPRSDRPGSDGGARREGGEGRPSNPAERNRGRRLNPANVHRQAVLASLPPEQQPIAEQLLRGGIPAVRTAISVEREKAVTEGRQAPDAGQLLALAEQILPRIKAAEWRDRAEAAAKSLAEISLRDLRSVVAGADAARDDETRALAASLREALDSRVTTLLTTWTGEIEHHLAENRLVRALRLAGRPPETSARLPAELAERLSSDASAALSAETPAERWVALLEAVAESPVRRSVKPAGLPNGASPDVLRAAHQHAGQVPALAGLLGIAIPPPPGPRRPVGARPPADARIPAPPAPDPAVSPSAAEVSLSGAEVPVTAAPVVVEEAVAAPEPEGVAQSVGAPEGVVETDEAAHVEVGSTIDQLVVEDAAPPSDEPLTTDEPVTTDESDTTVVPAAVAD